MKKSLVIATVPGLMIIAACTNSDEAVMENETREKHEVEIHSKEAGMMYVDRISCNAVMWQADSNGKVFQCYVTGFIDSLSVANATGKKDIETGKYYQYDVQNDWVMLKNGDSVSPVFFQPRQRLERHRYEGVLVFENKDDNDPDTLIYRDSYGLWGTQQVIINSNKQ
ncbi:MAG: hypothetical protein JNK14_16050 [Chitinophagaceae bacterium]|nr:hypothetical protein [Chitinophagaceae bacterium]